MTESSDPTELAGAAEAPTESVAAWSLEEVEPEASPRIITPEVITALGVAAGILAICGSVWLVSNRSPDPVVKVVERTVVSAVPPPVTVTAPPERNLDLEYLAAIRVAGPDPNGWIIKDPAVAVQYAHWYCDGVKQGKDPLELKKEFAAKTPTDMAHANSFAETVVKVYGCRPTLSS